ncbi:Beta-porphyranase A precursor [Planctomycetes bacterium MalM25]|nr:Beta-porphyranase A precursor [Planctomycetes bacterium MalM25]
MNRRRLYASASLIGVLFSTTLAVAVDVRPGGVGDGTLAEWNHTGELGPLPTRVTDNAPLSDQPNSAGWLLDASQTDEFNGDALDLQRWSPVHRTWKGRQPARFVPENVEVADGKLRLWMRKNGPPIEQASSGYHTYTSAAVQAQQKTRYGYYEVRAKPMNSAGSSSFWFAAHGGGWRTEIDVFELGGRAEGYENRYNMNLHVFYRPGSRKHENWGGKWQSPTPLADDFHVYGLEWTPERITYYFDGVPIRWAENAYWRQSLFLIFDSETMIDWLGKPRDADLPSVFEIDYVRVWRDPKLP